MATQTTSKKSARPKTPNRGAADVRAAIKDWANRYCETWQTPTIPKRALFKYLDGMVARAGERKGGLGRK